MTNPASSATGAQRRSGPATDEPGMLAQASTRLTLDLGDPEAAGLPPPRAGAPAPAAPGPFDDYEVDADFTPWVRALPYAFGSFADAGAVLGTVRWPRPPAAPATLDTPCGVVPNRTLRLDRDRHVAGVVVELTQIRIGRPLPHGQAPLVVGGIVELQPCRLDPPVQVLVPAPGTVTVDAGATTQVVEVISSPPGGGAAPTRTTIEVPAGGQRLAAMAPGTIELGARGHVSAWIYASAHPYVTTTDASGRFWLPDVAPGRYTLLFWHRPVRRAGGGETAPVVVRRDITVTARRELVVDVALPPAP